MHGILRWIKDNYTGHNKLNYTVVKSLYWRHYGRAWNIGKSFK